MAEQIEANYEVLEQVINKFNTLHADMGTTRTNLSNAYTPLMDGGWQGDAAKAHYEELDNEVGPQLKRLTDAFERALEATKQIAQTFEAAEEEAGNAFQCFT